MIVMLLDFVRITLAENSALPNEGRAQSLLGRQLRRSRHTTDITPRLPAEGREIPGTMTETFLKLLKLP
jgi:hypothetical protein